jgi:hypothetical protein
VRTIVAGSRGITQESVVRAALHEAFLFEAIVPTAIVSGRARGVDLLGEAIAKKAGVSVVGFPAKWKENGQINPRAGFVRNVQMALYADALVAVWDGTSPGTAHMIRVAQRMGLKVYVKAPR